MGPRSRAAAALCQVLFLATVTRAQDPGTLPFTETVQLGSGSSFQLQVINAPANVQLSIGTARHTLEGVQATHAKYTTESLPGDVAVGLLQLETDHGTRLVVLGAGRAGPVVIWSDSVSLRGDPGERRGYSLIRRGGEADPGRAIGIAEIHDGVSTCNGQPASVRPRWLNPRTLTLSPAADLVESPDASGVPSETSIVMDTSVPAEFAAAARHFPLRSRWSTLGPDTGPLGPLPSTAAVVDHDLSTGLTIDGRRHGTLVFGVSGSGVRVRALAFTVSTGGRQQSQSIQVRGDTGDWIPAQMNVKAGESMRYWLTVPTPEAWHCLEVSFVGKPGGGPLTISEVEAFTDADTPDGLAGLVSRVITEERGGTEAAALLVSFGAGGIRALDEAWERLGPQGKRRAVLAVAPRAGQSAEARRILARAVSDADGDLRQRALDPLVKAGSHAFSELAELARAATPEGTAAALAMGACGHPDAVPTLLALLAAPGGPDRADLRDALAVALVAERGVDTAAVQAWTATGPSIQSQAAALRALAHESTRNEALGIWRTLSAQPLEFTEMWRVVAAAEHLGAAPDVDSWLERLTREDERWMIRDAALASLWARRAEGAEAAALARLADEYPRVRVRAAALLATADSHRSALKQQFAQDTWPMVRARILDEVPFADGDPLPMTALKDDAPLVRIAAIHALTRANRTNAWSEVAKLLGSNAEWPTVMSAALEFAAQGCIDTAVADLRKVLRRGLKPNAWAPDVDLAMEAIEVLGRIGTPAAHALLLEIQGADQPPPVRQAAARAMTATACTSTPAGP